MNPFAYTRANGQEAAIAAGRGAGAKFLGGGTNLVDLMKDGVEHPSTLVDVNHIGLNEVTGDAGGVRIGASVKNSELANHKVIVESYPLLSQALLSGASPAVAEHGDDGWEPDAEDALLLLYGHGLPCLQQAGAGEWVRGGGGVQPHSRDPGTDGRRAEVGEDLHCDASERHVRGAGGAGSGGRGGGGLRASGRFLCGSSIGCREMIRRGIRSCGADELIVAVTLPAAKFAKNSWVPEGARPAELCVCADERSGGAGDGWRRDQERRAGAGGAWRINRGCRGRRKQRWLASLLRRRCFARAAEAAVAGAKGYEHNQFKVELAKQCVARALGQGGDGGLNGRSLW